jgi:hypothetical protein
MIISHEHRFCYFALPRTGSKAVSKALSDGGYGKQVTPMHQSYEEFMETAQAAESQYFTFCTVRNPLDSAVSAFFKKKNDHNGRFSRGTFSNGRPISPSNLEEYRFIRDNNADFASYFEQFHCRQYSRPRHEETVKRVDRVLRYENLSDDFLSVLDSLKLPPVSLPVYNVTTGKDADFLTYYPEHIRSRAKKVFGRLMANWGYDFPVGW